MSGEVFAVASTTDADGNVARAVTSVWLAGDEDWWFGGDNGDRMDVVAEQPEYKAGDTAQFQVRMPFRDATALVTVEREGVLSSFTTELSGKDPVIEVKLDGSYAPDVFVSVMAVRGRVEAGWMSWFRGIGQKIGLVSGPPEGQEPTALVDLAKPSYRLGIAKIKVGWDAHRLGVTVKADRERYAARDVAQVDVTVKTPDGKPARTADVAFAAVDQALLQLAPNDSWDVLTAVMGERPLVGADRDRADAGRRQAALRQEGGRGRRWRRRRSVGAEPREFPAGVAVEGPGGARRQWPCPDPGADERRACRRSSWSRSRPTARNSTAPAWPTCAPRRICRSSPGSRRWSAPATGMRRASRCATARPSR